MKVLQIISILLLSYFLFSCSNKVNLSTLEIERPLSLPNNYFGIGGDANAFYSNSYGKYKRESISPVITEIVIPYLKIKNKTELYFLLPRVRYQIIKTDTIIENILIMDNKNWVTDIGISGFSFDNNVILFSYYLSSTFKSKLNDKYWYLAQPYINMVNGRNYNSGISILLGYQLTNNAYVTLKPYFDYRRSDINNQFDQIMYKKLELGLNNEIGIYLKPKIRAEIGLNHSISHYLKYNERIMPTDTYITSKKNLFSGNYYISMSFYW